MNKSINLFNNLITNEIYDTFLLEVDNLNYINYKCTFNRYLKKFIYKCQKLSIKIFYTSNDKFYILNFDDIINQVNNIKKSLIQNHISLLEEIIKKDKIDVDRYMQTNNIISFNQTKLHLCDEFISLAIIVYNYKLLESNYTNYNIDFKQEYANLVNLSNLTDPYLDKIILIDEYSTEK